MSVDDAELSTGRERSTVDRIAGVVGDLDNPFYDEERDRDVWNEASAVGFQALLWGIPTVGAVLLWTLSVDAMIPVAAMLVPWLAASLLTLAYSRRHHVDPGNAEALDASPLRAVTFAVVVSALASGFIRASLGLEASGTLGSFLRGASQGAAVGFVGVAVWAIVVAVRERRRRNESAGEERA